MLRRGARYRHADRTGLTITNPAPGDRPDGLLAGEELRAIMAVRFSAGMQAHVDAQAPTSMYRPSVSQRLSYARWVRNAGAAGFPIAGPEMVIGVSAERLLVWRTALVRARPRRFVGAVGLADIQSAGVHRRVFSSVLTLLFEQGKIVGLESLHSRRLRELAATIPTYTDYRAR